MSDVCYELPAHHGTMASLVEATMMGLDAGKCRHGKNGHALRVLLEQAGPAWLSEERGRRLLGKFLELTAPGEDLMGTANDVLDNPESAASHYRFFKLRKKSGGFRDIEAPENSLKRIQRLGLDRWWYAKRRPAPCVHGFVPGKGTLTNAGDHVSDGVFGKGKVLIKTDFSGFFPSITRAGVMDALLDDLGWWYCVGGTARKPPRILVQILLSLEPQASEKMGLTENVSVDGIRPMTTLAGWLVLSEICLDHVMLRLCCLDERLCQGSPCSPALANVFLRRFNGYVLSALEDKLGKDEFTYTVYADDACTTFADDSTSDVKVQKTLSILLKTMYTYPDICPNQGKIGVFRHGRSQKVTGITITDKLSISKKDRDKVRARLHNAATGREPLTDEERMRIIGQRAWMRGVDAAGWDSRCEKEFQEVIGDVR